MLVHCWSHLQRRFVKLMRNSKSPIAEAAVRQIAALYAIETTVRGLTPEIRLTARKEHSALIIAALKSWFEKQLSMISSGSKLAEHIRYGLAHWEGLTRFLEDGRLELDTNPVENAIRPICLTRKNALFAGHEIGAENWGPLASIVATRKLCHVNPGAYLAETLEAIINGHPQSAIEDLMPWQFRKRQAQIHRRMARRLPWSALSYTASLASGFSSWSMRRQTSTLSRPISATVSNAEQRHARKPPRDCGATSASRRTITVAQNRLTGTGSLPKS